MHAEDRPDSAFQEPVLELLDDLEMQAGGLHLADRALEVEGLSEAQLAEVDLIARLHASTGCALHVATVDGHDVHGVLAGVGSDWLILAEDAGTSAVVPLRYVVLVAGLGGRAVPVEARPVSTRLSLRSVLRRLGEDGEVCAVHLRGGRVLHGSLRGVGADFVELRGEQAAEVLTIPLTAVAVVRSRSAADGRP